MPPPRKAGAPPMPPRNPPIVANDWLCGAAKLRELKDWGARAGAHARLLMAVVFHVRFANALEFQAREPTPEEPFQVRVATPGVPNVRVAVPIAFCPRATEAFPNRVVGEPVVGVDMRLPAVVPAKFLFPVVCEVMFLPNDVERPRVATPSRLLTAFLGVLPNTEGGPAPWKFATLRLFAAILRFAKDGWGWLPKNLPPFWLPWKEPSRWATKPS